MLWYFDPHTSTYINSKKHRSINRHLWHTSGDIRNAGRRNTLHTLLSFREVIWKPKSTVWSDRPISDKLWHKMPWLSLLYKMPMTNQRKGQYIIFLPSRFSTISFTTLIVAVTVLCSFLGEEIKQCSSKSLICSLTSMLSWWHRENTGWPCWQLTVLVAHTLYPCNCPVLTFEKVHISVPNTLAPIVGT